MHFLYFEECTDARKAIGVAAEWVSEWLFNKTEADEAGGSFCCNLRFLHFLNYVDYK